MPQLTNLVITDRATPTPVNRTFIPRGREGTDGGRLVNAGVVPLGDQLFTIEPRKTPGGRHKVKIALSLPVVQAKVEDGVTSYVVTRVARGMIEVDYAPETTEQERKDLIGLLQNSLDSSKALTNAFLINLESVF